MANSNNEAGYDIVLTGHLLAGANKARAATSLAKFLNASPQKAQTLLQGSSRVIKKDVNKEQALKYKALLTAHGIAVEITRAGASTKTVAKKPPVAKATPAANKTAATNKARATQSAKSAAKVTHISEAAKLKGKARQSPKAESSATSAAAKTGKKATAKKAVSAPAKTSSQALEKSRGFDSNTFNGMLQTKPVTMLQQLALVASCSALVVLAVFYVGIFVSIAFFALERLFSFLFLNEASSLFTAIFIYLLPCFVASLVCVLLLRPVFAGKMKTERLELDAGDERNLLNFVKQIASMVGAPRPETLTLTDEFEVVAEFQPGWKPLKEGRVQMRVGLPLLMVLDIPALAGAVVSALARFDDKTGMYMLKVIREMNLRLDNAYHNRDNWQDVLDRFAQSKYKFFSVFLTRLYQPVLSLSAWFALPFLLLVRLVSAATSRIYCYRADNYFAAMAGTRKFVEHFTVVYKARYAYAEAEESLRAGVESQKFVNDLPALLMHAYKNLAPKVNAEVDDAVVEHTTQWNDLSPCNRDRMIKAEEDDYEGIVVVNAEAWRLLQDLKASSRRYTLAYYKMHDYGVDENELVDARELATSTNEERMRDEICRQYFNGWFEPDLFWQTNQFAYAQSISKQQRIVEINECIKILRRSSPEFVTLKNEVPERFKRYAFSRFAVEIHKAGYRPEDVPGLEDIHVADLVKYNNDQRREYETRRAQQRDLCRVMGERLCFALAFIKDPREHKIAEVVLGILAVLEAQANQLEALRHAVFLVPHYRERIKKKNENEHTRRLRRLSREILYAYETAIAEFKRYRWPFGSQYSTLADYIARSLPKVDTSDDTEQSFATVFESRLALYNALWKSVTQANRFLNGKIAPLAQKAELENNIARIKMAVTGQQAG